MNSLQNKRILITRTAEQSRKFSEQVEALGGIPIVFPLIKLEAINTDVLIQVLAQNKFDWIIFTSPQAVKFFFEKNKTIQNNTKIAVVGNGTKKALKVKGIDIDFIPSEYTAKKLATEIPVISDEHIFIPRSNLAKNDIVKILEQRNCKVTTLDIYQNKAVEYTAKDVEEIKIQEIDFITFTSGSAVQAFVDNKMDANCSKVVCIGPETAKIANDLCLEVSGIASSHNIEGIVNEIIVIAKNEAIS